MKLNSSYSRIVRYTGLGSTPPASRRISQETLRRWERSAREASIVCNQSASFNRCLVKVQQSMKDQLKSEQKGKGSAVSPAVEELQCLLDFNASISQAAAKSMEHLSEFVFITMGNLTLVRRDAYLSHLRTGIKQDTLTALRTAPLHISTLFPDTTIKRAEEEIAQFEAKSHSASGHNKGRYHPYERVEKKSGNNKDSRQEKPAWKTIGKKQYRKGKGRATSYSSRPAKGQQSYKWQLQFKQAPYTTAGRELTSPTDKRLFKCKSSCCSFCHYCARAIAKERFKSRASSLYYQRLQIKICEKCFVCHSIVSCQFCLQCTKCCPKSSCRGQTSKLLGNLARSGSRTQNNPKFEGRLYPPLPELTQTHKISNSHKLLCQSPQEQLPVGGIASAYGQKCSRAGSKSNLPGVFQPTFSSSQTQQMEAHFGSEQTKPLPQSGEIQNGNTGNHQNIPPTRGVGHLSRLQRCLLPHTNTGAIQEIPQISYPGPDLPIQGTTLWSVHSSHGIYGSGQRGETDGLTQGYKDPPVPRRLVCQHQIKTTLFPPHPDPSPNVSKTRLAGEHREIRIGSKTNLQLRRLPIRPPVRSGQTYTGPVAKHTGQDTNTAISTDLFGQTVHVTDRPTNSHREARSPRPVTHETHSVAS